MKLDYSALDQPVTSYDIETYQTVYGTTGFSVSKTARNAIIVFGVVILVAILGLTATGHGEGIFILVQLGIGVIIALAFAEANKNKIKKRAKIYKFALANDAQLLAGVSNPAYSGAIFDHGDSRSITDAVILTDGTELGNYTYTTGSGKSRSEHHWGYTRVKLSRRLPHMLLDAKSNNLFGKISNLPQSFGEQTLSLEGDFDKYFTLYVPDNYQRDALYVLTPDVMAALIDAGQNYDVEIIDDQLFIYGPVIDLTVRSNIEQVLNVVDKIGTELRDQTEHYSDERTSSRSANVVAEPGRRLKKRWSAFQIVTSVAFTVFVLYVIISANSSFIGL